MEKYSQIMNHDAFRYGYGLNKTSAEVYWNLLQQPMKVSQLVQKIGRGRSSIYRALKKMEKMKDPFSSDPYPMVRNNVGIWSSVLGVDLNKVASFLGSVGIAERKHQQYQHERMLHRKGLANEVPRSKHH